MGLGFTIPLLVYVGKKSHKIYGFMCLGEFPEPPSIYELYRIICRHGVFSR